MEKPALLRLLLTKLNGPNPPRSKKAPTPRKRRGYTRKGMNMSDTTKPQTACQEKKTPFSPLQFSENVRFIMALRQIDMVEIHNRTGLDPLTIFRAINANKIRPHTRQTLADALGVSVGKLEGSDVGDLQKTYARWPHRKTVWTWLRKVVGL